MEVFLLILSCWLLYILYKIFFKKSNPTKWMFFLDDADEKTRELFSSIFKNFFEIDNIDENKFLANYMILNHSGRELYRLNASLKKEGDLSELGTKSIDRFTFIGDRPLGYYKWFIAAYPDVIIWSQDLDDRSIEKIIGNLESTDLLDLERKINPKYLRKIIDAFKRTEHTLETI